MITNDAVRTFLEGHRIAVVGAADRKASFGGTVCRALAEHGYDPIPIHPSGDPVDGRHAYARLAEIPGAIDGVIVMVPGDAAAEVVNDAAILGIRSVWLFKGVGGAGAVSEASLAACERNHIDPIAGACPLMFLEPVTSVHHLHRGIRRLKGDVERAPAS